MDELVAGLVERNDNDVASRQRKFTEPMRVSILSKRKQISQFVCGRKHNLVVINGPYGPNCSIVKGLNVSNTSLTEIEDKEY